MDVLIRDSEWKMNQMTLVEPRTDHRPERASESDSLSLVDAGQVEMRFEQILDNRILLCFVQDTLDGVGTDVQRIDLRDVVAVPNRGRVSLDEIYEDVVVATGERSILLLIEGLNDTLTFTCVCVIVVEKWDRTWTVGRSIFKERVLVFLQDAPGAAPQDTQLQVDAHHSCQGLTSVVR